MALSTYDESFFTLCWFNIVYNRWRLPWSCQFHVWFFYKTKKHSNLAVRLNSAVHFYCPLCPHSQPEATVSSNLILHCPKVPSFYPQTWHFALCVPSRLSLHKKICHSILSGCLLNTLFWTSLKQTILWHKIFYAFNNKYTAQKGSPEMQVLKVSSAPFSGTNIHIP